MLDRMRSIDAMPPRALARWIGARDAVLRGLVHSLSNRVGTVVAASGILAAGGVDVARTVLGGEAQRLDLLLTEFRFATDDPLGDEALAEPLIVGELVAQALALRTHVGDARAATVTLDGVDEAPPASAARAALLQALVVLLAGVDGAEITVRARADEAVVQLATEPAAHPDAVVAAEWLLGVPAGHGIALPRLGRLENAGR